MQSVISVRFIETRGQLISLSKDKVSCDSFDVHLGPRESKVAVPHTSTLYLSHKWLLLSELRTPRSFFKIFIFLVCCHVALIHVHVYFKTGHVYVVVV